MSHHERLEITYTDSIAWRDDALEAIKELEAKLAVFESHEGVDAFWKVWQEIGEPHKHGVYESTWSAFRAAIESNGLSQFVDSEYKAA